MSPVFDLCTPGLLCLMVLLAAGILLAALWPVASVVWDWFAGDRWRPLRPDWPQTLACPRCLTLASNRPEWFEQDGAADHWRCRHCKCEFCWQEPGQWVVLNDPGPFDSPRPLPVTRTRDASGYEHFTVNGSSIDPRPPFLTERILGAAPRDADTGERWVRVTDPDGRTWFAPPETTLQREAREAAAIPAGQRTGAQHLAMMDAAVERFRRREPAPEVREWPAGVDPPALIQWEEDGGRPEGSD